MMNKWKDFINRIAMRENSYLFFVSFCISSEKYKQAAAIIEGKDGFFDRRLVLENEILEYARNMLGHRLIFVGPDIELIRNKKVIRDQFIAQEDAEIFGCGEYTESCVWANTAELAHILEIPTARSRILLDLSVGVDTASWFSGFNRGSLKSETIAGIRYASIREAFNP